MKFGVTKQNEMPMTIGTLIKVALWNRADHYIFILFLMAALCNRGAIRR